MASSIFNIVLLVTLSFTLASSSHSCSLNITQSLRERFNGGTAMFDVYIENESPSLLHKLWLVSSTPFSQVLGMETFSEGLLLPATPLPPHTPYNWSYIKIGLTPAEFKVTYALCDEEGEENDKRKRDENERHHGYEGNEESDENEGHHHPRPTSVPTLPPPVYVLPTDTPSQSPDATSPPTSSPPTSSPPTSSPPTSSPPSSPTSTPTQDPTSIPTSPTNPPSSSPSPSSSPTPTSSPTTPSSPALDYPASPVVTEQYFGSADSSGFCTGSPKTYKGKLCASTTKYWDGSVAACGCGSNSNSKGFSWVGSQYTAAGSPPVYGYGTTFCGSGCGKCYELTTTGYSPLGRGSTAGQKITVMLTNLCPPQDPWCSNGLNGFKYTAHFDLADDPTSGLISKLGWDNAEVTYEEVACGGTSTPSTTEFSQCQCATA